MLYVNNKLFKNEIKKTILFIAASKSIKYLGINLIPKGKDLYTKYYKTLIKYFEDINKRKISHVHELE